LTAQIPAQDLLAEVRLPARGQLDDLPGAVEAALRNPVGPRLEEVVRRGESVLVMTVDHTRPNPSPLLWPLLQRLEYLGARPEIMIGLGNHRAMTKRELEDFLGIHQVHQNDCRAEPWSLGTTRHGSPVEVSPILREFDRRVVLGFIEPHYIAGFSGGRKMVLPGCASHRATTHNHFLTLTHGPQLGRLDGNPVHEDMQETALAVGVDFILDAVLNPDDSFHSLHAGDLVAAHRQGVERARQVYQGHVPALADVVITSPGGWPYDVDMVQAKKALAPALDCVRPGGAIILVGECSRGWGASQPDRALLDPATALETRARIAADIQAGRLADSWPPCSPGLLFMRAVHDLGVRLIVVSSLAADLAGTYLLPAPDLEAALALAREYTGPGAKVTAIHEGRRALVNVATCDGEAGGTTDP
jgi:nickel-dependent lactate racemase